MDWNRLLPVLFLAVLWLDLCRQLSYTWETNEQYSYGWFVPLLAMGLLGRRWPTRPEPRLDRLRPWWIGLVCGLGLVLLPVRIVHEINQNWSFCSYLFALSVVVLSLHAVYLKGGWPWVRHFGFAICFILVAVNWPYRIENSLKHRMMNAVAAVVVELAGWLNIPALRHGNVIELATGSVGVEDACSGMRSLQSTVMAALFLGELYLLDWPRRMLLLAVGLPLAFVFNIARTLFLTWQASVSGGSGVEKWHDVAGMGIFLLCFACLWLIGFRFARQAEKQRNRVSEPEERPPAPPSPGLLPSPSARWRPYAVAIGLWSVVCIAATEIWYRTHDTDPALTVHWVADFPTNSPSARKPWIGKGVRQVLKFDYGDALSWEEKDGSQWSGFFFRWRSGEATSRMAARDHRPEICLPSSGYALKDDRGTRLFPAHGLELPFRVYTFESAGQPLHVFFCLWEDGADEQVGLGRSKYLDRLDSVLAGRRRLGQQTLEFVVSGYPDFSEAERAVRTNLPSLTRLGNPPPRNGD